MRRLIALVLAAAALAGCSDDTPVTIGRSPTSTAASTAAPTTTTTLATAATVAASIVAAETAIRSPPTPASDLATLGQTQQIAYRALAMHPEWDAEVLSIVPSGLRSTVEANVAAGRELGALTPSPEPDTPLPKWRIVAPDPADQLLGLYRAAGTAAGVPWQYLAAIHLVETRMGRIKGDSSAGAQGPMQFIPTTWDIYGQHGDITSNRDAIFAAGRLLRAAGAPADMARALRGYNNSARYVRAVTAYAREIEADERADLGYDVWQVYYGARLLPEGTVIG